jgi:hypothetical protein
MRSEFAAAPSLYIRFTKATDDVIMVQSHPRLQGWWGHGLWYGYAVVAAYLLEVNEYSYQAPLNIPAFHGV